MGWTLFLVVGLGLTGCVSTPVRTATLEPRERAQEHARRFDHVERLVRTRYYAPDLHGVDWVELCARYRPQAIAAADEGAWYRAVNGMLRELRDAHTRAERPQLARAEISRTLPEAGHAVRDGGTVTVLADGTVVVRFDRFDTATVRWLEQQIETYRTAPGMVIDLRENRGGLVTSNQRAVGLFFPEPVTIGMVVRRDGSRVVERSKSARGRDYSGPLAVLVGAETFSSAEVFARVMQHYERAVLVGLPTAGKVLGARPYRLRDGGRLYVSTTDFFGCDGQRLESNGVRPDVPVIGMMPQSDLSTDPGVVEAQRLLLAAWAGAPRSRPEGE